MNEVSSFITTVGFPIAITCGLLYLVYSLGKIVVAKIIVSFDIITKANEELVKTNSILASKIEEKLDIVIDKLDNKEV